MTQLLIGVPPGFVDLDEARLAAHQIVTEDTMVKLSQISKFGAVRAETFFAGFYKHGDTIALPVSPVDGYVYDRRELRYSFNMFSTRGPGPNFLSGQLTMPSFADGTLSLTQSTNLYWSLCNIDDVTGMVSTWVSYFLQSKVPETITHDGIVRVNIMAQRQSVNF